MEGTEVTQQKAEEVWERDLTFSRWTYGVQRVSDAWCKKPGLAPSEVGWESGREKNVCPEKDRFSDPGF